MKNKKCHKNMYKTTIDLLTGKKWSYGVQRHFQQYFSYIVGSVLLMEETGVPGENHRPAESH